VTTYYRPVLGGAEAAAERLARFLARRGHAVTVLTKRTSSSVPDREIIDGVQVERLGAVSERAPSGKWVLAPSIVRTLIRRRRDFAVVCCVDYRGLGLAALAARTITGTPVVFQAQTEGVISGARIRDWVARLGLSRSGVAATGATWPVRALYGHADAIGCISHALEREAIDAGVPQARVHYLPNPVDEGLFTPLTADERREVRAPLGVPEGATVGVFVGRLSREKGVVELLTAWARARPNAHLLVIGPAMTDHPWDVSEQARAIVASNHLEDRVHLLGGQTADVVARYLKAADFAVQPSHFEAMGLAAAEEMAAGLPVIASDTGGFRDFVIHDRTGWLVPVGDVDALATAITRLADDPALRARLGAAARTAAGAFDARVVLERFATLIDDLAAAR
jgi:glycosyltransferase involved in cell wall biosynthesis